MAQLMQVTKPANSRLRAYFLHKPSGMLCFAPQSFADLMSCRGVLAVTASSTITDAAAWRIIGGAAFAEMIAKYNPLSLADVKTLVKTTWHGKPSNDFIMQSPTAPIPKFEVVGPRVDTTHDVTLYAVPHTMYSFTGGTMFNTISNDGVHRAQVLRMNQAPFVDSIGTAGELARGAGDAMYTALVVTDNTGESILNSTATKWKEMGLSDVNIANLKVVISNWMNSKGILKMKLPYPVHLVTTSDSPAQTDGCAEFKLVLDDLYFSSQVGRTAQPALAGTAGSQTYTAPNPKSCGPTAGRIKFAHFDTSESVVVHYPIVSRSNKNLGHSTALANFSNAQPAHIDAFSKALAEKIAGIPLAQIFGHQPFGAFRTKENTPKTLGAEITAAQFTDIVRANGAKSYQDYADDVTYTSTQFQGVKTTTASTTRSGNSLNDNLVVNPHLVLRVMIDAINVSGSEATFDVTKADSVWALLGD